ncbi:MAG: 3-mercaptopyruvate sulfurtransferase [Alphaproteobacteria bacterium]|jgi:thiosulfate/3-mercaptopyruvate sulfurtransferase|nr:3-mercaptopyruvate sulfurtransferase [Alphaproteobacteria bacterium]MDP7056480.1 3-mercaptopyruvate sulfurtransferase [Alphaproteobacteria bacterium]MDP7230413.1 3-mercaptopyruvate sulfurtransferase [Alphaproteobacteria bacterium]MDP7458991.1 3-mercaptopyruvate sulfurtransferase [Alphaproteobacteria bacterium]|tara:strand:+ start:655 stop:1491 length:837 start_codon:yes stop_codon:yes gene_type:complete
MSNPSTVSTDWLADNLEQVKILDGSFYLPAENRDADAEYVAGHIPGAQRFNIDVVCAPDSGLPHMFPEAQAFADAVGAMGIGNDDMVVTYDGGKLTGACRVWWMFRTFGHGKVAVLDGGRTKWQAEGRTMESTVAAVTPASFSADYQPGMVRSVEQMLSMIDHGGDRQIIDARGAGRFDGTAAEPRAGLRSGHMPGAFNLPYDRLVNDDGSLRPADQLRTLFTEAGVNLDRPAVTSCGSGVSATVLLLGLDALGHKDNTLYDGSWSEWGSRQDTPVVT